MGGKDREARAIDFTIKFWGVRGSFPTPGKETLHYGGNTTCVEVRVGKHLMIFDCGTGLIPLGDELVKRYAGKPIIASIFLTHTHHDHTLGLPFFKPAYMPSSILYMFGPSMFDEDIESVISKAMIPAFFPVRLKDMNSMKIIRNLWEMEVVMLEKDSDGPVIKRDAKRKELSEEEIRIQWLRSKAHPKDGVVIYKVEGLGKSFILATDTEGYSGGDSRLIAFAQGADVLIHDAQFTSSEYLDPKDSKQGYGHSTPEMAAEVAMKAGIKQLILFHHDPYHSDQVINEIEENAKIVFPNTTAAYEGMEIVL